MYAGARSTPEPGLEANHGDGDATDGRPPPAEPRPALAAERLSFDDQGRVLDVLSSPHRRLLAPGPHPLGMPILKGILSPQLAPADARGTTALARRSPRTPTYHMHFSKVIALLACLPFLSSCAASRTESQNIERPQSIEEPRTLDELLSESRAGSVDAMIALGTRLGQRKWHEEDLILGYAWLITARDYAHRQAQLANLRLSTIRGPEGRALPFEKQAEAMTLAAELGAELPDADGE